MCSVTLGLRFVYWQWHPTPVLLPGKSHGWRSLVGCSPWGHEELEMIEQLHFHFSLSCIGEGNGNPFQYSCLENPRDRGAWWAAAYGVSQSRTRLKWLSSSSSSSSSFVLSDFFSMWFVNYQINISFRKYNFIMSFLFPVIVAQTQYSNNAIWLSWADYLKQCLGMLFMSLRWLENGNFEVNFDGSLLTYQNLML